MDDDQEVLGDEGVTLSIAQILKQMKILNREV